jgi:hypothetical protein
VEFGSWLGGVAIGRVARSNDSDSDSTLDLLKELPFAEPLGLHPGFVKEAQPQFLGGGSRLRLDVIRRAFAILRCVSFG